MRGRGGNQPRHALGLLEAAVLWIHELRDWWSGVIGAIAFVPVFLAAAVGALRGR